MGEIAPQILFGRVGHARLFPRKNAFSYGIYYLSLPLSKIKKIPIAYNRFGLLSFHDRDHGACDGSDLLQWANKILSNYKIENVDDITLICMPRVLGYVFNPVSFWVCRDTQKNIRVVLCEVHNTFGEKHCYVCAHQDHRPIQKNDILIGEKLFHVSPFLKREGHYKFQFDITDTKLDISVDFYDQENQKQLVTYLNGEFVSMDHYQLRKAFWRYPLVTIKAIILIHWQALKLIAKSIKYIPRPKQNLEKISGMRDR